MPETAGCVKIVAVALNREDSLRFMRTECEQANAVLRACQGGYARLWEHAVSHQKLTIRVELPKSDRNFHLLAGATRHICSPAAWELCRLKVEVDEDRQEYVLLDAGAGVRICCADMCVVENAPPETLVLSLQGGPSKESFLRACADVLPMSPRLRAPMWDGLRKSIISVVPYLAGTNVLIAWEDAAELRRGDPQAYATAVDIFHHLVRFVEDENQRGRTDTRLRIQIAGAVAAQQDPARGTPAANSLSWQSVGATMASRDDSLRFKGSECERVNAVLRAFRGGYVQLWEYTASSRKLTVRITPQETGRNCHVLAGGTRHISSPTTWESAQLKLELDEDLEEYVLCDPVARARICFDVIGVVENAEPVF